MAKKAEPAKEKPAKAKEPVKAKAKEPAKAKAKEAVKAPIKAPAKAKAKEPVKAKESTPKAMDLFEAYSNNMLPKDHAYIVSSFIKGNTGYTKYEVISYSGVKAIYPEGEGLTFQSSGKKMHILVEPASYPKKATEPYLRDKEDQIPLRFKELEVITCKNQIKVYIAKKPIESLSSFTVAKPVGFNISFLFYELPNFFETMTKFFEQTFNKDAGVPQADAKKAAKDTVEVIKNQMGFKGDFGN